MALGACTTMHVYGNVNQDVMAIAYGSAMVNVYGGIVAVLGGPYAG